MSEETTQEQNGARPFEERVLSMLSEMRADFNTRLERLEAKQYDTKPIWQQALTEIVETRAEVAEVRKQAEQVNVRLDRSETLLDRVTSTTFEMRADLRDLKKELREHFPFVK
jgi:DNA repair exonuclease SbcCD ATPase subunit